MSEIRIKPGKLKGTVAVPPSKSLAHRAIICASLSKGKSVISHIEYSQDILATIGAMEALGTSIEKHEDYLVIDGSATFTKQDILIDCKESGSTVRFMIPISLVKENQIRMIGQGNLGKRPLDIFYDLFDQQGIQYQYTKDILDLRIHGKLTGGNFEIPGNISSQFITGLLFALPLLEEDSVINITTNMESKGYIDLTLDVLKQFGIQIINHNYKQFIISGRQEYSAHDYYVEADYSQAAFYLVADAIGNEVVLKGLNLHSVQGDAVVLDLLKEMGCEVIEEKSGIRLECKELKAITIDGRQCPDIIPVMSLALALSQGTGEVINSERLRIKECDRLKATHDELSKLGIEVEEKQDGLVIQGGSIHGNRVSSWNDHRMAMTLAIASTVSDSIITIDSKECVKKSYPSFWDDFKLLGGNYE